MCDHCGCRAFGPIAELTAEHESILALAWEVAEASRGRLALDPAVVNDLLRRLDVHVAKEESGLYPLLADDETLTTEATQLLEDEHRVLRSALESGHFDRTDYYALAAHAEAEEMELFPAAMFAFDEELWDRLDAVHRRCDAEPSVSAR